MSHCRKLVCALSRERFRGGAPNPPRAGKPTFPGTFGSSWTLRGPGMPGPGIAVRMPGPELPKLSSVSAFSHRIMPRAWESPACSYKQDPFTSVFQSPRGRVPSLDKCVGTQPASRHRERTGPGRSPVLTGHRAGNLRVSCAGRPRTEGTQDVCWGLESKGCLLHPLCEPGEETAAQTQSGPRPGPVHVLKAAFVCTPCLLALELGTWD